MILGIIIISSPILFAIIAYPDSVAWSWNEGRGGYLFALIFVVAELIGLKILISKRKLIATIPISIVVIGYLFFLENGFRDYLTNVGEDLNVQLIYSWTWMWDFIVMAILMKSHLRLFGRVNVAKKISITYVMNWILSSVVLTAAWTK